MVQLFQKTMSKEAWPALQLTSDEELVAHMVNNTVNIYSTADFSKGIAYASAYAGVSHSADMQAHQ